MAWLSALACVLVGAQDQGSLARLQTPLSISALMDLLAHAVASHPLVQAQIALLNAAQQGLSNARWECFPTPSISVQSTQSSGSNTDVLNDSRIYLHVVTANVDNLTGQYSVLNKLTKPISRGLTGALNER
jgi:outer membrane protein TolC